MAYSPCVLTLNVISPSTGLPVQGVAGVCTVVDLPYGVDSSTYLNRSIRATSDSSGNIVFTSAPQGSNVKIVVAAAGVNFKFNVPALSNYTILPSDYPTVPDAPYPAGAGFTSILEYGVKFGLSSSDTAAITANTTAIQAAVNDCIANKKDLYVPGSYGTQYLFNAHIDIAGSLHIWGGGAEFRPISGSTCQFRPTGAGSVYAEGISFYNSGFGFGNWTGLAGFRATRCTFYNNPDQSGAVHAINFNNTPAANVGFTFFGVHNCVIQDMGTGVGIRNTAARIDSCIITENSISYVGARGVQIGDTSSLYTINSQKTRQCPAIIGNTIEHVSGTSANGIISYSQGCNIVGNYVAYGPDLEPVAYSDNVGIYSKAIFGLVSNNQVLNFGSGEGSILAKGQPINQTTVWTFVACVDATTDITVNGGASFKYSSTPATLVTRIQTALDASYGAGKATASYRAGATIVSIEAVGTNAGTPWTPNYALGIPVPVVTNGGSVTYTTGTQAYQPRGYGVKLTNNHIINDGTYTYPAGGIKVSAADTIVSFNRIEGTKTGIFSDSSDICRKWQVLYNTIRNLQAKSGEKTYGILFAANAEDAIIKGNIIEGVTSLGGVKAYGMSIARNGTRLCVEDNTIWDITGAAGSPCLAINEDNPSAITSLDIISNDFDGAAYAIAFSGAVTLANIQGNTFRTLTSGFILYTVAPTSMTMKNSVGMKDNNTFLGTFTAGATSRAFNHGLEGFPTGRITKEMFTIKYLSTIYNSTKPYWVSAVSDTQVTITCDIDPGTNVSLAIDAQALVAF